MNVQQHVGRADQVAIAIRDAEELFAKYKAPMLARLVAMSIDYRNPRFPIKHNIDAEHTLSLSCITSPKALERIARGKMFTLLDGIPNMQAKYFQRFVIQYI